MFKKIKKKKFNINFLELGSFLHTQFCKNWWACNFFAIWLRMLILFSNDVDIQLILEFEISFGKNCPVFPKNPKHFFLPGAFLDNKFCKNSRVCNFFAIWLRMLISFLNDAYIKLVSEFKDSFGKYYPVFPKNQKNWGVKIAVFLLKF